MIDRDLPLKKTISENIKRLMKERGWTQLKTSEMSGISKSTLSDYINCKTLINPGNVEKLAKAFNVKKSDIDPSFNLEWDEKPNSINLTFTKLPIVGAVSCGNGVLAYQDIEGYEEVPTSWLNGGEYFFVRAKGDSMINARIMDGDLLLIRRQEDVDSGEIAAVLIDDEIVLKRVYKTNGTIILQSENPKYQPIVLQKTDMKNVQVIGKLKKVVLNF
ncbi:transcriptional repressor LexA [Anoxybacillus sp. EFIL]|uniref:transcriptional repressor LexA n=1 Tax=Anoxybacillus sp. EFIL TaxID=2508869 RepID=UPI00148C039F|nr:transcriptional repressor LexA [Anoxybacillus sp. EFIL]NNU96211.1 repressor LexA [Anoxybacillus sp. EFIL]